MMIFPNFSEMKVTISVHVTCNLFLSNVLIKMLIFTTKYSSYNYVIIQQMRGGLGDIHPWIHPQTLENKCTPLSLLEYRGPTKPMDMKTHTLSFKFVPADASFNKQIFDKCL